MQLVLLVILLIAIVDFLIGTFIPRGTGTVEKDRGFTGYSGTVYVHVYISHVGMYVHVVHTTIFIVQF